MGDFIVEDTYKAGAFRIHFAESVRKSQTRITHGECSGFFVTDCQRDEVKRAGVRCNTVAPSRPLLLKVFVSIVDRIQVQQITTPLQNDGMPPVLFHHTYKLRHLRVLRRILFRLPAEGSLQHSPL